jgi:hypothetical protein
MFREFDKNDPQLDKFKKQADELRGQLITLNYFNSLSEKCQKHFLRGNNAWLLSQDNLLKRMNEDVDKFRGIYRFFSFHIHSLPVSFYRMTEREQGRGIESDWEKTYMTMALDFALKPIQRANEEMLELFPDILPYPMVLKRL